MGNRYAGTGHQHSTLADRTGSPRHRRHARHTSSIATEAAPSSRTLRSVHRGCRPCHIMPWSTSASYQGRKSRLS